MKSVQIAIQKMTDMHKEVIRRQNQTLLDITSEQIAKFDAKLLEQHNKMMKRKNHKSWLLSQWIRQTGGHVFSGEALKQAYRDLGGKYKSYNLYCLIIRQLWSHIGYGFQTVSRSKWHSSYGLTTVYRYDKLREVQEWLDAKRYNSTYNHW